MFQRNRIPAFIEQRATFAARKPVAMVAASDVPAHVAAEWTGDNRPNHAAARLRALLA